MAHNAKHFMHLIAEHTTETFGTILHTTEYRIIQCFFCKKKEYFRVRIFWFL